MKKDIKVEVPYVYDTPMGIVEKQGDFYRKITSPQKSLILRIGAAFFAFLVLFFHLYYFTFAFIFTLPSRIKSLLLLPLFVSIHTSSFYFKPR